MALSPFWITLKIDRSFFVRRWTFSPNLCLHVEHHRLQDLLYDRPQTPGSSVALRGDPRDLLDPWCLASEPVDQMCKRGSGRRDKDLASRRFSPHFRNIGTASPIQRI
jgi:hypothetical protein